MELVASHPRAVFMGQSVCCPGTALYRTLEKVPLEKRIELPVAEDMQLGLATGAALNGDLPICIYPRWNFLLLATSQLVLHLDKLVDYSAGGYRPKVIIRTAVGSDFPLNPGHQHLGDYSSPFRQMLKNVSVAELFAAEDIVPSYEMAMRADNSTILVEYLSKYDG